MTTIITREPRGRVWLWQVKQGNKVIAGGYCRTKRDATNDAQIWINRR